jgi:hypothetical protein
VAVTPEVHARLERIERLLTQLVGRQPAKQWHTVEEFSQAVGKAPFTVRQWCNRGRIRAERSMTRCGRSRTWAISHDEYLRYQREGLLPPDAGGT